mgnify:CR=1 FL=1
MTVEDHLPKVKDILPKELFFFVGPFSSSGDSEAVKRKNDKKRLNRTELTHDEAKMIARAWDNWSEAKRMSVWPKVGGVDQHIAFKNLVEAKLKYPLGSPENHK